MNIRFVRKFGLALIALLSCFLVKPVLADNARTGTYTLAILQVSGSDESQASHAFGLAALNQAAAEMAKYYSNLSYGKLNLVIKTASVTLPNNRASYYNHCNVEQNVFDGCDQYTKDAVSSYLNASSSTPPNPRFFDGVDGVAVLMTQPEGQFTRGPLDAGVGHDVQVSYLHEEAYPLDSSNNFGPSNVSWQGWVHEIGHEIQFAANLTVGGVWNGHPSGYFSGYDLMDSCYPCGQSAYGLLGKPYVNDNRGAFPGWLDAPHVATVPVPSGAPVGMTFVLPALATAISSPVVQAVKVPIDSSHYYFVNARTHLGTDALQQLQPGCETSRGICDEGVQIQYVDESADPPVLPCMSTFSPGCGPPPVSQPPGWPYTLWHPGQTLVDAANSIQVSVITLADAGYTVEIDRQEPTGRPNLFVEPWLTPPMDTYETIDIWVDSSCNGYEDQGGELRYGRRADGTVIGNGDDPCANHENRIYATVHNIGQLASTPTTVTFEATNPIGVGVTGQWQAVNTVPLPAIPAGKSATVYAIWTPTVNLTSTEIAQSHFAFHSCVRVTVTPPSADVITTNKQAQENIDYFEASTPSIVSPSHLPIHHYSLIRRSISLTDLDNDRDPDNFERNRMFTLYTRTQLPEGATYKLNNGERNVFLKPGERLDIPVSIQMPDTAPVGSLYSFQADAYTNHWLTNKAFPATDPRHKHFSYGSVGGVDVQVHTVYSSHLSLQATIRDRVAIVSGGLSPARTNTIIAIDYRGPSGKTVTHLTRTDGAGRYRDSLALRQAGSWQVQSIWQGDITYQSAVSSLASLP